MSDSIPLNKSFENQQTSDTYGSADASRDAKARVLDVWGLNRGGSTEKSAKSESRSFASLETAKVTNTAKQGLTLSECSRFDLATPYTPSLDVMCESTGDEETRCHEFGVEKQNSGRLAVSENLGKHVEKAENHGNAEPESHGQVLLLRVVRQEDDDEKTNSSYADKQIKRRLICAVVAAAIVFSLGVAVIAMFAVGDKGEQNLERSNAPPSELEDPWEGHGSDNQLTERPITEKPIPDANQPVDPTTSPILQQSKQPAANAAPIEKTRFPTTAPYKSAHPAPDSLFPVASPTRAPAKPIPIAVAPTAPPQLRPTKPGTLHPTTPPTPLETKSPLHPTTPPMPLETRSPSHAPVLVVAMIPLSPPPVGVSVAPVPGTAAPSAVPQPSPSDSPTCRNAIAVNEECVLGWRDDINVDFGNCDPQDDDWIGIWPDDENPDNLSENYVDWVWSCGTQSCLGAPNSNRVVFEKNRLPLGIFRAFLIHEPRHGAPYYSHVMSQSFAVTNYCGFP